MAASIELRVSGVHVEAAVAQDRDGDRVAVGVVEADRARVVGVPERVPALRGGFLVAHAVATVRDAPGVDGVRHAVVPAEVVVRARVGVRRPHARKHVGDQLVLQGHQQVAVDEAAEVADGGNEHVGGHLAVRDLLDALLHVVEGRDLDVDPELFLELGDDLLVDVVGPVVEHQRARLERRVGRDRVHRDRQLHGVLERGDRDLGRAGARGPRGRVIGLRTCREDRGERGDRDRAARRLAQELPPRPAVLHRVPACHAYPSSQPRPAED